MAKPDEREWFITPSMSLALDLVRVVAALIVLAAHTAQSQVYRGPWPFSELFQHAAVIVFFVLSGLVIGHTTFSRPTTLRDYTIARVTRILPVALPAAALGAAAMAVAWSFGFEGILEPLARERLDAPDAPYLLFLLSQLFGGYGPAWNPPIWSLSYEIWYYVLFGAVVFCKPAQRNLAIGLIAVAAGPRIVLLAPVWLSGVWLARQGGRWRLTSAQGILAMGGAMLTGFVICQTATGIADKLGEASGFDLSPLRFSQCFLSDWAMTPVILLAFVGMKPLAQAAAQWLERHSGAIRALAGASFTLYLMHWPVLVLLQMSGFNSASPLAGLAVVVALQLGALGIAQITEARRYALRAMIDRRIDMAGRTVPA